VCILQLYFNPEEGASADLGVAMLECRLAEAGISEAEFTLLNTEFFDDQSLVIVYRVRGSASKISPYIFHAVKI